MATAAVTAPARDPYLDFVRAKIIDLPPLGLPVAAGAVNPILHRHQPVLVKWLVEGGRRALFANFGLGKTMIQLETMRLVQETAGGVCLIVVPLTVVTEFKRDAELLGIPVKFVRTTAEIVPSDVACRGKATGSTPPVARQPGVEGAATSAHNPAGTIFLTNYESVREGKIDTSLLGAVSLDEASCLRGFGGTKTFREFMRLFDGVRFKFVATATPSPNEYVELLAYAAFLEVMDVGQAKTRFFKRDSEDADNLTIHPHKVDEFWLWVNSWAAFVQRPSDLGFSDEGYELPELDVRWHEVASDHSRAGEEKGGQHLLLKADAIGIVDAAREKRDSLSARIAKMMALRAEDPGAHRILWHDLEAERAAIEASVPERWFGHWGEVKDGHPTVLALYDRHYSSRTLGEDRKLAVGPGEKMVLLSADQRAAFAWRKFIDDSGQHGVNGAFFRNEGESLSSELIQHAMAAAWHRWPGQRLYTFVDAIKTADRRGQASPAGKCFFEAGWRHAGYTQGGLDILEARPGVPLPEVPLRAGLASIYGAQDLEERARRIIAFSDGETQELAAKPVLAGSGCNFQRHCAWAIFLGIGFKFNDFIQAIHRIQRFLQTRQVRIDLIHSEAERAVRASLEGKWARHKEMCARMSEIIRTYGLGLAGARDVLERTVEDGSGLATAVSEHRLSSGPRANAGVGHAPGPAANDGSGNSPAWQVWRGDTVLQTRSMASDSVGLIVTSVPFGTQYEYSPSYNDFGHTDDSAHFFAQMDFLTPELLRVLQPGRRLAVHVKDRVRPGGMDGLGFQTVDPFHADCIAHYRRHGFAYLGMITIVTDVVRENAQTYRLGWTEQCKDGSRMGVGMPEYLLLFRKAQTDRSRGYADDPVVKAKPSIEIVETGEVVPWDGAGDTLVKRMKGRPVPGTGYSRSRWQNDAAGMWRSSGDRVLTAADLAGLPAEAIYKRFRGFSWATVYDHEQHVALTEEMERRQRLPVDFALLPPQSWHPDVWTDVARMYGANTLLSAKGREQHLCPLPFDIVDRAITGWSNPGDLVFDPFAGVMTVPLRAVKHGRRGAGVELNADYFADGVKLLREQDAARATPSLFDLLATEAGPEPVEAASAGSVEAAE